jgi:hypothetical protein
MGDLTKRIPRDYCSYHLQNRWTDTHHFPKNSPSRAISSYMTHRQPYINTMSETKTARMTPSLALPPRMRPQSQLVDEN